MFGRIVLGLCAIGLQLGLVSGALAASDNGLVAGVAKARGISEAEAQVSVDAVFAALEGELKEGRDVTIKNFGKFHLQERAARTGRNPKTGEPLAIPAKKYPRFASSDKLKASVNGGAVSASAKVTVATPEPQAKADGEKDQA